MPNSDSTYILVHSSWGWRRGGGQEFVFLWPTKSSSPRAIPIPAVSSLRSGTSCIVTTLGVLPPGQHTVGPLIICHAEINHKRTSIHTCREVEKWVFQMQKTCKRKEWAQAMLGTVRRLKGTENALREMSKEEGVEHKQHHEGERNCCDLEKERQCQGERVWTFSGSCYRFVSKAIMSILTFPLSR